MIPSKVEDLTMKSKGNLILTLKPPLALRREGGSGVIFACLAHIKVPFSAEQPLFTE